MHTQWFAVDADGHIGQFDTGRDGPVPWAVLTPAQAVELFETTDAGKYAIDPTRPVGQSEDYGLLIPPEDCAPLIRQQLAHSQTLSGADFQEKPESEIGPADQNANPENGLFSANFWTYRHETDIDPDGSYRRNTEPAKALHIDELAPPIRALVEPVRFKTMWFAETDTIDLPSHVPCEAPWDAPGLVEYNPDTHTFFWWDIDWQLVSPARDRKRQRRK